MSYGDDSYGDAIYGGAGVTESVDPGIPEPTPGGNLMMMGIASLLLAFLLVTGGL